MIKNFFFKIFEMNQSLLIYINHLGAPFMDHFWIYMTKIESWLSLYLVLSLLLYHIWGWKKSCFMIFFLGSLILFIDQISDLFKDFFKRDRPCQDPILVQRIRLFPELCRASYSFFSSHSANHVALAIFLGKLFRSCGKYITFLLIIWALLVSYSRLYLAVHYPLDVLFGIGVGLIFGHFFGNIFFTQNIV